MEIKVLALDLDGTLTNSEKKITDKTRKVLQHAMKDGLRVVLASGRPTIGVLPLAKKLKMEQYGGYVLSFNGGKIIDCTNGEEVYSNSLPKEVLPDVCNIVRKHKVGMLTYQGNTIVTEDETNPYVLIECRINKTEPVKVECLEESLTEPVPKCLIVGEPELLAPVKEELEQRFENKLTFYYSEPYFLEVMPLGVEKSASLARLLEILKLKRENLMACGDGLNDLTMLKFAGLGVAMENACQQAKHIADVITASNDEDGVAVAVNKYILCQA